MEVAKALADAQIKATCKDHVCKLNALRILIRARKSELLQERNKGTVEQKQLRTEHDVRASRYLDVLSAVRRLVLDSTSGKGSLEGLGLKLQLL